MGEGGGGLPWIQQYFFLTFVHFTRGIISHHTRNNRPFQSFFYFFYFFFFPPYGIKESGEIRQLR